ncbi:aminodeoxychorismate lyase [Herbiconiux sp. CPCC 205763]|uniref:Aminodeoxychorismate lyase n=1 Tax=Herbiconiux aconitum TaxID=2970913 RepID=A0ABT2GNY6_9MICO|nr:aminodeoxychorismate lyase [Herbiconiux aconitum]MCS5717935.1 aminodeoxychorismate lyase [Herbiconiux aconitum]
MVDVTGERMGDLVVFLEEGAAAADTMRDAAAGTFGDPGTQSGTAPHSTPPTQGDPATQSPAATQTPAQTTTPTQRGAVPLAEARIGVADLAVTRGDGIFESIGVIDGRFIELDRHLRRLEHSAALLDLPRPDSAAFAEAARRGLDAHSAEPELLVKLFYSRGIEGAGIPSGWVEVLTGDDHRAARSTGIRVVTLDRGYRHDIAQTSPWLLQGAKTLSYALNKAALREAARRDADDVIFVSTDDVVLEGPTSNVLVRHGDLFRTPRTDLGILAGTTQAAVFETLMARGFETIEAALSVADLASADAVWLLSSGRLLAPVRELDGQAMPVDREFSESLLTETFGVHP